MKNTFPRHCPDAAGVSKAWQMLLIMIMVTIGCFRTDDTVAWDGGFEKLQFRISWWLIPGAEAVMQAAPGEHILFQIQACTNPTFDLLHKVRDSIVARARRTADGFQSIDYQEIIREGHYRNDLGMSFTQAGRIVITDHNSGHVETLAVPSQTLDLITAFYAVRGMELEVGERYEIPVVDRYKTYDLSIEVLAREVRATLLGESTATIIIRPLLQAKGVFKRDGAMRIWLTDDYRHLPVRVATKISIGSIYADLVALSRDSADQLGEAIYCGGQ